MSRFERFVCVFGLRADDEQAVSEQLREFAKAILACRSGTLDGCDIEELAIKHGLLMPVRVAAPCNDVSCACAEVGNLPGVCYRATELLNDNRAQPAAPLTAQELQRIIDRLAALQEEYHITRATLRSGLSNEQNVTYPTNLDKLQFLLAELAELRRDRDAVAKASKVLLDEYSQSYTLYTRKPLWDALRAALAASKADDKEDGA